MADSIIRDPISGGQCIMKLKTRSLFAFLTVHVLYLTNLNTAYWTFGQWLVCLHIFWSKLFSKKWVLKTSSTFFYMTIDGWLCWPIDVFPKQYPCWLFGIIHPSHFLPFVLSHLNSCFEKVNFFWTKFTVHLLVRVINKKFST